MALIPYRRGAGWMDPFAKLETLQKQMNQLFDVSLARSPWGDTTLLGGQWAPAVDLYDSPDNILIKADLPGLRKDEIELTIHDNQLILKGEKKKDARVEEDHYFKSERFYGSFCRTVPLPVEVDADKVDASYQDGVLTVTLPKKEEVKPKQISIDVK